MDIYESRRRRAREIMRQDGVDALVVTSSTDLTYLTGHVGLTASRVTALVFTDREAVFYTPEFELDHVVPELRAHARIVGWKEQEDPLAMIASELPKPAVRAAIGNQTASSVLIGLQERRPDLQWVQGSDIIGPLRIVKDDEEIENLRIAQSKAEEAYVRLTREGIAGLTERQASQRLSDYLQEAGLRHPGSPIVASGENGASPHHLIGDRFIREGDAVVIDFGGQYRGYRADITRTPVIGYAPEGFKEAYEVVLAANRAAFEAIRPGAECQEIDRAARKTIEEAGYGPYFTHRLGHGLGLDGHEEPFLVEGNRKRLQPGHVFTDEPGIYIPGRFGIRIEDVVAVTADGARHLTSLPRELQIIG
ncbi:M24 family metallopeptidase [Paenibacillaceae bacterium WGS1546]|uniref:M24 family metallopeptidase n=1 Tax=Cohnella sp. WGS1546 TaxID=3366810 RepID=UPI00372D7BE1